MIHIRITSNEPNDQSIVEFHIGYGWMDGQYEPVVMNVRETEFGPMHTIKVSRDDLKAVLKHL